MRTTLTIDDVLAVARALPERNSCSLGRALSELARRGLKSARTAGDDEDGTVFAVAAAAGPITNDDVYQALGEWP